ncbi:MAG TPA: 4-hydroxy-tetrahydrodipicolinate reductase [Bacteroidia bacterium]|jgi:4-hydroxy-tetrahydrodipicolinate reductase|nr:4-hydroxy-tetrahydrodipicolinate reductase [Bacteroidia bacterium]
MNIALFGYGKMGKEIEQIALQRNHSIVLKINRSNINDITPQQLKQADVAIEFSTPDAVIENIYKCFNANLPIVTGTTGWYNKFDEIKNACLQNNQSFFYATNFSLGVNLFFKMNEQLAKMMNSFSDYEVAMQEIHHIHKLDKPSGTAITTAEKIVANHSQKNKWSIETSSGKNLFIDVVRTDEVPGTHTVSYTSAVDEISITHKAFNRKGFALGAVLAAEFIQHKKGVYTMNDLLNL